MGKGERHRKYDPEFKKEVLRLVAEGKPAVKIAEDFGIPVDRILCPEKAGKKGNGSRGLCPIWEASPHRKKSSRLSGRTSATRRERDIMKIAPSIFSKEP